MSIQSPAEPTPAEVAADRQARGASDPDLLSAAAARDSAAPGTRAAARASRHARRRPVRAAGRIAGLTVLALMTCSIAVIAVAVVSGRWQIRPVLSGSMRPTLPVGGVVITERVPLTDLRTGQIAVFHPPFQPAITYVHRIISIRHSRGRLLIRTKGDANVYPDPWTLSIRGRWAYVARGSLPWVGYAAVWVHSAQGRAFSLLASGLLASVLVGSVLLERRRAAGRAAATSRTGGRREPDPARPGRRHRGRAGSPRG
ncbi:MAG: signal peptidase I [Actinomycetota bacterium]|nr:signal peptidase I [Actinomycetota bacterium]